MVGVFVVLEMFGYLVVEYDAVGIDENVLFVCW